jgi:hypothetical protein
MVNTTQIKKYIEPYIRKWLSTQFTGHIFQERQIPIGNGKHKFDAVSEDGSIVGDILCNRPKTRGGNENTGAVRKALNDMNNLKSLPNNVIKLMIFTDQDFRDLVFNRSATIETQDLRMIVCKLPATLEILRQSILNKASNEQKSKAT